MHQTKLELIYPGENNVSGLILIILVVIMSLELAEREKSDAENLYRMHSIDGSDPFQWSSGASAS